MQGSFNWGLAFLFTGGLLAFSVGLLLPILANGKRWSWTVYWSFLGMALLMALGTIFWAAGQL